MARRSGAVGRRRADRSGRPPDRPGALVPRRLHDGRRLGARPTSGTCRSTTTPSCCCARAGPDRVPARELHRVEEPVLARDLRPRRQARTSTASAAATASSGWRTTGCCRRWVRPRRRSGSIPGRTSRGRREFAEFARGHPARPRSLSAGLGDARAALDVVEQIYAASDSDGSTHMIITRSPLRITLGGGGTDLPSYYREHGGFLIAAAIDKYVYVTVMRPFIAGIFLKYSKLEHVDARRRGSAPDHPRGDQDARRSGRRRSRSPRWPTSRPAPAWVVGQLHHRAAEGALRAPPAPAASRASSRSSPARSRSTGSSEPIGKQDQYIAAYGGVTCFTFPARRQRRGRAAADRRWTTLFDLEDNLLLFFTGFSRSAGSILADQNDAHASSNDQEMLANLHYVKELGLRSRRRSRPATLRRLRRADARALGAQEASARAA